MLNKWALLCSCNNESEAALDELLGIGGKGTVLEWIMPEQLDVLLNVELSDACSAYLDPEWWGKYNAIRQTRSELLAGSDNCDIDIF